MQSRVMVEAFTTPVPVPTIRARWVQWENVKARITAALGPLVASLPTLKITGKRVTRAARWELEVTALVCALIDGWPCREGDE